jgi:hypothetical protein
MGVKIVKRDYEEIFTLGSTNWLLGNVGEWQTLTIGCEVSVDYYGSVEDSIFIDPYLKTFKRTNGKSWAEFGFDVGQTITYSFHYKSTVLDEVLNSTSTILAINGDTIEVSSMNYDVLPTDPDWQGGTVLPNETHPYYRGDVYVNQVRMYADIEPEGCRVSYVHTTNSKIDDNTLLSLIDGSTTSFVKSNVIQQPLALLSTMTPVGLQSGMSIRGISIKRLGRVGFNSPMYAFEVKINFLISSFFESINDIIDRKTPSFLTDIESLTDNFKLNFYPKWNNPNAAVTNEIGRSERLGNTGWFDENYNELPNKYKVDSVSYFDINNNPVASLDYSRETKVEVIISGATNVNPLTKCGFGFIWLPKDEADYKLKKTPFHENTFISNGRIFNGYNVNTSYPATVNGYGINNAKLNSKNVLFSNLGSGKIKAAFTFFPTPEFTAVFDKKNANDRFYALWVSVADSSLLRNFSDRVSLLVETNQMVKSVPPLGVYSDLSVSFLEHPYSENEIGVSEYDGFVQDDVLVKMPFFIDPAVNNIRAMRLGVELRNANTGQRIILEKFDADFSTFLTGVGGEPYANLDLTRGFRLDVGNNKNWIKIQRNPLGDIAGKYSYIAYYAFKIRYEDWIANSNVTPAFFDTSQVQNGLNNDWFEKQLIAGWRLNFFTEIDAIVAGSLGTYGNSYAFFAQDYDSNTLVDVTHSYIRDSNNATLNIGLDPIYNKPYGVILQNEFTRLEFDFVIIDNIGVWDIDKVYGVVTLEVDRGAGILQMRQLSTIWPRESDNPLTPVSGETNLKLEVNGNSLKLSCLVDPTLLEQGAKYRTTARVGCFFGQGEITGGKYEERYEFRYE